MLSRKLETFYLLFLVDLFSVQTHTSTGVTSSTVYDVTAQR